MAWLRVDAPTAAVREAYRRMAASQRAAWITVVAEDEALARARSLEDEGRRGRPLWGVPFAVKDNIDVAGLPTTVACPAYAHVAERTAPAVQRLFDAGAVLVGKTNLDQFATGLVGTRSPYGVCHSELDPTRISGGSSAGSAVAVAAGVVPFALGTDTAGSGRVPAAANGIVGLKPTRGVVSTEGVVPACRSLDCVSVFATTVADALAVLSVLGDVPPVAAEVRDVRLGVPPAATWGLAPLQAAAYEDALAHLADHGFAVVEVDPAVFLAAGELLYGGALVAERLTVVGPLLRDDPDALDPAVRAVLAPTLGLTGAEVFADLHRLDDLRAEMGTVWASVDALVLPTVPDVPTLAEVAADPLGVNRSLGRWTNGVNLLDLCAVTIPRGTRPDGLAGSVTVVGPTGADLRIAAIAAALLGEEPSSFLPPKVAPCGDLRGQEQEERVELVVVGAHLRGLPLNHQLTERAARFVRETRTAPTYRLYALDTEPPKPGLVRVAAGGNAIDVEVWSLDVAAFGSFVAAVPPPLTIGTVTLADGTNVKGFLCEPTATTTAPDITNLGSWRRHLASP